MLMGGCIQGSILQKIGATHWRRLLFLSSVGIFLVEAAIPVLVMSPFVKYGIYLDFVFHMVLGVFAYDFSLVGVGCLPFFLSPSDTACLVPVTLSFEARASTILFLILALASQQHYPQQPTEFGVVHVFFYLFSIGVGWQLWKSLVLWEPADIGGSIEAAMAPNVVGLWGLVMLLFTFLNGAAPYLGLKTQSTWTMFSNLQVEGGRSNHFFIPCWQPFSFLRDVVVVLDSDLPAIRDFHSYICPEEPLRSVLAKHGIEAKIHGNSPLGTHGGGGVVLPYCVPYMQLQALASHALRESSQPLNFKVDYLRCVEGKEALLSGDEAPRHQLVVVCGRVETGDSRLVVQNPVARKFGFCRSWLTNRHPECFH